jgi:hypothetical protein
MVAKVNGAAYPGVWVERNVSFVKITFSKDIRALAAADLVVLGTATPVGASTVANSAFGVVESVLVKALKALEVKATILGIGASETGLAYDVMLGHAEGWFAPLTDGIILAAGQTITGAQAKVTTAATAAPLNAIGDVVGVTAAAVTYTLQFAKFDALPAGTGANGAISLGVGSTPGSVPAGSATGTPGWYPTTIPHAS